MKSFRAIILSVVLIILAAGAGFIFRSQLYRLTSNIFVRPCQKPITYSIGAFDTRFGISRDYFLKAISQAEQIWEQPIGRQLFAYDARGSLTINLIYDTRQESTVKLQSLGIVIRDDRVTYDALKTKYNFLQSSYNQQKTGLEVKISAYQVQKDTYDSEVAYWNKRRGISEAEYNRLEQERNNLNAQIAEINRLQNSLNELVDIINAAAQTLNRLADELNLSVNSYNGIGAQQGREFEEGTYVSDISGQSIDIYQFNDRNKLVRVLAHELGHALGLDHLNNSKAIMYRLNQGINEKLTVDDIVALKKLCRVSP